MSDSIRTVVSLNNAPAIKRSYLQSSCALQLLSQAVHCNCSRHTSVLVDLQFSKCKSTDLIPVTEATSLCSQARANCHGGLQPSRTTFE